jgi:hypothetical protein
MSTYNLSKNDLNTLQLYEDEYKSGRYKEKKNNRFAKTMMYTGLLVGGLVIGQQAVKHEYYMNNTTIYGIGGVMTILATGLVLTSVNGINKNLFVSIKKEGLTMCLAIN